MNTNEAEQKMNGNRRLQIASLILLFVSGIPCLITGFSVSPVIHYGIETGNSLALQLLLLLSCTGVFNGVGIFLLAISLFRSK